MLTVSPSMMMDREDRGGSVGPLIDRNALKEQAYDQIKYDEMMLKKVKA